MPIPVILYFDATLCQAERDTATGRVVEGIAHQIAEHNVQGGGAVTCGCAEASTTSSTGLSLSR
jgi:hypothetical protein